MAEVLIARGDHSEPHRRKTAADFNIDRTVQFYCFDYEYARMLRPLAAALPCYADRAP